MDTKKIAEMTDEELAAEIADAAKTLFNYRFAHATGQLETHTKIRTARTLIARLKTAQRARQLKSRPASA